MVVDDADDVAHRDGRVELGLLLKVDEAHVAIGRSDEEIFHGDGELAAPVLERELGLVVDVAGARGNAAVEVRGADGARDGVQVRHEVAAEDGVRELGEEALRLTILLGEERQEARALVPARLNLVLEHSLLAFGVRLVFQVLAYHLEGVAELTGSRCRSRHDVGKV